MFTLTAFVNNYQKTLASHLATELKNTKKADMNEEMLLALIKAHKYGKEAKTPAKAEKAPAKAAKKSPAKSGSASEDGDDNFQSFGKFKTMKALQTAHEKAVAESKYVNAKTGSVVQDSKANRNKGIVFYDSNVCGEEGSDELTAILGHFAGSIVEAPEAAKADAKASAKKSPAKKAAAKSGSSKADASDESESFEAFGKFKTMKALQSAHEKAVKEGKYVNAKTGSVVQDSKANRNKGIVFYDSNVCGEEGSDELTAILGHFAGSIVEAPATPAKSGSAKSTPIKEVDEVEEEEVSDLKGDVDEELDEE